MTAHPCDLSTWGYMERRQRQADPQSSVVNCWSEMISKVREEICLKTHKKGSFSLHGLESLPRFKQDWLKQEHVLFCFKIYLSISYMWVHCYYLQTHIREYQIPLQLVVSHNVVAGNWSQDLWKSSQPLSHLSTPARISWHEEFFGKHVGKLVP